MYPPNEIKKEKIDRGIRLGPDRYDSVVFRDDGSVFAQLCRRTIIQGRTLGIEYDIHNSNLTGVCDEEDTAVRLRTEKILVYSALAIIVIMLYGYAASVPQSNTPGGFDYNPVGFGSPRMGIYAIIGLAMIVGIAYFLSKRYLLPMAFSLAKEFVSPGSFFVR